MRNPETPAERDAHIAQCIGCSLINYGRQSDMRWVACYEHKERNVSAVKKLMELYSYDKDAPNMNYPVVDDGMGGKTVNLHALIDDISSRFERGTLIAGEHRN